MLYIRMAVEVYEKYKEKQIEEQIYFDTFSDFRIWSEVCEKKCGACGLTECEWLSLPLELKIFRLGRLQFEPVCLQKEIHTEKCTLPEGTNVLNVHIPEDGRLRQTNVWIPFCRQKRFSGKAFPTFCLRILADLPETQEDCWKKIPT